MAALALPRTVRAQKVPTIGLLWNDSSKPSPYVALLLDALKGKGYVPGRNLHIEDRVALEGYGPMPENAAALVRARVDLIVTFGATATLAAAKATKEIPIVTVIGADPVAQGLAGSLSRPGGNVTGIWMYSSELVGKRIELLKELNPATIRVGILFAPGSAIRPSLDEADTAARTLKIQALRMEVRSADDIEAAVASLAASRVDAICATASSLLASHSARVVAAVAKQRIPAIYANERFTAAGGLMVYGPSQAKAFLRAATHVDSILKGARAAEMPIEQARDVELAVNLKTAKALGIKVPQSILVRADQVIE